uniref:Uncharacterized protein n=1 Tax=Rhizophagus irregularis (strain DAOM 181602 / DAOM 197198 / MUCL 43194) TaxID=747089 RepID=U9TAW0_RHIID
MFTVINKNPKKDSKKKFYVQDVQERLNYFLDLLLSPKTEPVTEPEPVIRLRHIINNITL